MKSSKEKSRKNFRITLAWINLSIMATRILSSMYNPEALKSAIFDSTLSISLSLWLFSLAYRKEGDINSYKRILAIEIICVVVFGIHTVIENSLFIRIGYGLIALMLLISAIKTYQFIRFVTSALSAEVFQLLIKARDSYDKEEDYQDFLMRIINANPDETEEILKNLIKGDKES